MPRFLLLPLLLLLLAGCSDHDGDVRKTVIRESVKEEGYIGDFGKREGWWTLTDTLTGATRLRYYNDDFSSNRGWSIGFHMIGRGLFLLLFFGGWIWMVRRKKYSTFYYMACGVFAAVFVVMICMLMLDGPRDWQASLDVNDCLVVSRQMTFLLLLVLSALSIYNMSRRKTHSELLTVSIIMLIVNLGVVIVFFMYWLAIVASWLGYLFR